MARPRTFDEPVALEQAMQAFWTHGYEATSAERLVRATGASRSSLYQAFGSKEELFHAALRRYAEASALPPPDPALGARDRLRSALRRLVEPDLEDGRSRGCLACNTAIERGPLDAASRELITAAFAAMRAALAAEVRAGVDAGELCAATDPDDAAASLLVTLEGLHVIAKGTGDRRMMDVAIDRAVDAL